MKTICALQATFTKSVRYLNDMHKQYNSKQVNTLPKSIDAFIIK